MKKKLGDISYKELFFILKNYDLLTAIYKNYIIFVYN